MFYAVGAAIVGILVAVIIWVVIQRSSEGPGLGLSSPTISKMESSDALTWLELAKERHSPNDAIAAGNRTFPAG